MQKILTIAGSDCSGGAGIQADIKTITAHKMYAMSVITSLTAQNTMGVDAIFDIPVDFIKSQLDACFRDIIPDAIKIGMVSNAKIIMTIIEKLKEYKAKNIVVDPVMVSNSGAKLLQDDAIEALLELFKIADVITPNISEAEILSDIRLFRINEMKSAAIAISKLTKGGVLIKGGHLESDASDVLFHNGKFEILSGDKIYTSSTHGTGCTLSSAIACALGAKKELKSAVLSAKYFVTEALKVDLKIGHGNGAIDHYFRIAPMFD